MTTKSNQKYWERRHLQTKAKQIKSTEAYEKALQPELNGLYRDLHGEMEQWYTKYANANGIDKDEAKKALNGVNTKHWQLTLKQFEAKAKSGGYKDELDSEYYRSRVARLQDLEAQLQQHTQSFTSHRTDVMRNGLAKQYDDTYMRTNFNIQASKGAITSNFARFNEAQLKMAVSSPWGKDGKDFSKRIWKNYQKELPSYLMDAVLRGTVLGWSPAKVSQMFHARFQDIKKVNIHNLVVSEMGHVAEEATAKGYEENDIEQYEYMATLESHTCDICGRLDGQIFRLDKRIVGINYPLIHARCRCTTVPYMDDLPEMTGRWYRDPETGKGKLVRNMKFGEWKKLVNSGAEMPKPTPYKPTGYAINLNNVLSSDDNERLSELGTDVPETFMKILEKAPENMKKLFATRPKAVAIRTSSNQGSYYLADSKLIQFDKKSFKGNTRYAKENDVLFHELAHSIDDTGDGAILQTVHRYLKRSVKDADIVTYSNYSLKPKYGLQDMLHKEGLAAVQSIYDEFPDVVSSYNVERAWREQYIADDDTNWRPFADFSDMVDAATNGGLSLGFGHGKGYWTTKEYGGNKKVTNGHAEAEFFAESTSATINNPESLAQIKKYFPESYKIYLKMVDDIIKERSEKGE